MVMQRRLLTVLILTVLVLAFAAVGSASAATIYVNKDAINPYPDGTSWTSAFTTVQAGLNATAAGDEVWVAKGTYVENITLKTGAALYGGFVALETELNQRDFKTNETILDGNQSGSVVTSPVGATQSTRIDGFTIRNGSGTAVAVLFGYGYYGGGLYCNKSSPTITNNVIKENTNFTSAGAAGCGIYLNESSATVTYNAITRNNLSSFSRTGPGIYSGGWGNSPNISHNIISNNGPAGNGGGICISHCGAGTVISYNTISGNGPTSYDNGGGGIYLGWFCEATVSNNLITGNSSDVYGGGVTYANAGLMGSGRGVFRNNIVSGNSAKLAAGMYLMGSSTVITNNIIANNNASQASGGIRISGANHPIINNTIVGNTGADGFGGIASIDSSSLIANNIVAFCGGGISASTYGYKPVLRNNNVFGNTGGNYINLSPGIGDISIEPLFADRINGDYHLTSGSPCIDAGDDSYVQAGWVDMDGEARILGAHVDIGADEVNPDTEAPSTGLALDGTLGNNGWYISDVTATLAATDTGSGVNRIEYSLNGLVWSTYTEPFTISDEGINTVFYRAVDNEGNVEEAKQAEVKIDKGAPFIFIGEPSNGVEYTLNEFILTRWLAMDYVSGIFTSTGTSDAGLPFDTTAVGQKSFVVIAEDRAGHETAQTVAYFVRYDYTGLLQPINQDGTSIFEKAAGRTIPVKFQLKDANDNYVGSAVAKLYLTKISNEVTGTEVEAVSTDAATEGNTFSYESSTNEYAFNLATEKLSVGTWQLRVALDDGASKLTNISVR